jgi:prolyl oligopeptidase
MRTHPGVSFRRTLFAAVALTACARGAAPPETRRDVVVDTFHGVAVEDPYRWLENQNDAEVRAWIAAQNAYADSVVGRSPLREQLEARLRELMGAPDVAVPRRAGEWEYFTLRRAGDEVAAIYRRKPPAEPAPVDPDAEYDKIIDPLQFDASGTVSVNLEGFSPDGNHMLYTLRDGGRDEVSVRVFDIERRVELADSLPPALYSSIAFDPNGRGFYYSRRSRQTGARILRHTLGTSLEQDSVLFGDGYGPTAFVTMNLADQNRWRLFTVQHGWQRHEIYLQDARRNGPIVPLVNDADAHFAPSFVDGRILMRTDLDAPKGRIVSVDPSRPARSEWRELIAEGEDVLESFTEIDGKLYVTFLKDVSHRIRVYTKEGQPAGDLEVPDHSVATLRGAGPGMALLTITSLSQPPVTYRVNLATGERTLWEASRVPFDAANIEVKQVFYTSRDGTRAPMYIMHARGITLDGSRPTLLHGYGGFNVSLMPRFDPRAATWVEQGGVYALATLRGGAEYGEDWHRAGWLQSKQNVFDDFIAAAEYLTTNSYTSAEHLAIRGGSNGGLLMGSVITQRPELFRAAFVGVPDLDMVRFWTFTDANNMPALLEYGDASRPEEFEFIRRYSPYQNVSDGTRYPAVMVHTGDLDTRVPPLQGRKFAARLQAATRSGLPVILHYDERMGHAGGRATSHVIADAAMELTFLLQHTRPSM